MMTVPFLDIGAGYRDLKEELDQVYSRVMESGHYVLGREVEQFEKEYARFCGTHYCVGVSSGLAALVLLLKAYGIGPGDEVLVPSNTFIATWLAVSSVGAVPVSLPPESGFFNLDPKKIEENVTRNTKAIIPVHLYGHPAEMKPINDLAEKFNLIVIEDAAQAQGATYFGRKCGSLADSAGFSFYPGKNLGAFGDGGAICTSNESIYKKLLRLRNYGSEKKYVHDDIGFNARLDELQAGFLRVKLNHLQNWNARRRKLAERYTENLYDLPVSCPVEKSHCKSSWHLYVLEAPDRDRLQSHLREAGITTLVHYPISPAAQRAYSDIKFRELQSYDPSKLLSLPMDPYMSLEMCDYVCDQLTKFYKA